jgi:hypothetical protein
MNQDLSAVLDDIEELLDGQQDVRDGPGGEQLPNMAMTLLGALREARAKASAIPKGWKLEARDGGIAVTHPDLGGYFARFEPDNIASTVLHRLAEALLAHG